MATAIPNDYLSPRSLAAWISSPQGAADRNDPAVGIQAAVVRALADQLGEAPASSGREAIREQLAEEVARLDDLVEWARAKTRRALRER